VIQFLTQAVVDSGPEPASTLEILVRWSVQVLTIITGFGVTIYTLKKKVGETDQKIEAVREEAAKASKFSEPTGNGFAAGVKASLARIEDRQEHLEAGLTRVETRLDRHIDKGN